MPNDVPQGCPPLPSATPAIGPADMQVLDPCALLNMVQAEYYKLLTGANAVRIRFQERETTYGKGDLKLLQAEVRRLEILCSNARGNGARAVQAGPPRPLGTFPLGFPPSRYRGF